MYKYISDKKIIELNQYLFDKTKEYSTKNQRNKAGNSIIQDKQKLYQNLLSAQNSPTKYPFYFLIRPQQTIINIKPSLFSVFQSYMGIGGVYNPLSAEAIYNKTMPDIKLPFVIAHEMAHQLGFASETEANFMAFLTALNSKDNSIKYSAYYTALKYTMRSLIDKDPMLYFYYLSRFNQQMKKDYQQEKVYFDTYHSDAEKYVSFSNDLFLKLNNQKEGIESYNKFVYLLLNII